MIVLLPPRQVSVQLIVNLTATIVCHVDSSFVEERCSSSPPCLFRTDCVDCTLAIGCLWCPSISQCVPNYPLTYPYAQCLGWINSFLVCPSVECGGLKNCTECQDSAQCGWCNDPSDTGRGECIDGGFTSPRDNGSCYQVDEFGRSETWNFDICPGTDWFHACILNILSLKQ